MAAGHAPGYNETMGKLARAHHAMAQPGRTVPPRRILVAWTLMIGSLVGFWGCRPWLASTTFNYGQLAVLLVTWKIASLLSLPPEAWARLTPLRLLGYCCWYGMQPRQFLKGEGTPASAPVPSVTTIVTNCAAGASLLWLVPRVLPAATPVLIRLWIALIGLGLLTLFVRLDIAALIFRAMGFAVERVMDCPVAASTLGEFWGRRWNRIVSGMLREVVFLPLTRWAGARVALFAVFAYSALYHEGVSFMVGSGYGGPTHYFALQYVGVAIENSRPARRLRRGYPWLGRAWTWAVVVLPVGLFVHPGIVDGFLIPLLVKAGVPGLNS